MQELELELKLDVKVMAKPKHHKSLRSESQYGCWLSSHFM